MAGCLCDPPFSFDMLKRIALVGLFVSMLLIGAAYASAFFGATAIGGWLIAMGSSGVMVFVLLLGAIHRGFLRRRFLGFVFLISFLALAGGFAVALRASDPKAESRLWLGLPVGAAVIIYIVGLLPMLILPIAYAMSFDDEERAE